MYHAHFVELDLLPSLEKHLVSLLKYYFCADLDSFAYESFKFVPRKFVKDALVIVSDQVQDFDDIFIALVKKLGVKHEFIDVVAPRVRSISVKNLKVFSDFVPLAESDLDRAIENGYEYFARKIKGLLIPLSVFFLFVIFV
jgi:hypothetical protein